MSFSANVSPSSCILDFLPGLFRVSIKPFLFYVEEVNPFLSITKKGSSLPSLKNIFLPLHISCSYSSLSTSSHPKFSRKFSLLAVSICPPRTYSSVHSTPSSTPITGFKMPLWSSGDLFAAKAQGQFLILILPETSAVVQTVSLLWNDLVSQASATAWFSSHLPGFSSIFFAGSCSLSNLLEFLQTLRVVLDHSLSLIPLIKTISC